MADAASKAASRTVLQWGAVEVEVGLFTVAAKPSDMADFDTAGPNGGVLKAQEVARATPVEEAAETPAADAPVQSDPLAVDMKTDADRGERIDPAAAERQRQIYEEAVDGMYGRELVEDGTGVVVPPEDVRRGVRLEDGRFIDCTAQLAEIGERTKLDKMQIVSFIDVGQVERFRIRNAYYVGAMNERAPKALRLLFEALRQCRRAAVVKVTKTKRQALGVLVADGRSGTVQMLDLVWAEDVRDAPARAYSIRTAQVGEGEVLMACELVRAMADTRDSLDELRDDAIALREELRAQALRGEVPEVLSPVEGVPEPDLADALEASIAQVR